MLPISTVRHSALGPAFAGIIGIVNTILRLLLLLSSLFLLLFV